MTYTGEVTPGGATDVRTLSQLRITKCAVDPEMSNNVYLLTCRTTGSQVLIDAADEGARLLALLEGPLATVVTTHQHWDHHRALREVVLATEASTVAGVPDAGAITEQTGVPITRTVVDGDVVSVGECSLQVIAIAGHTPGSICLRYDDPGGHPHLFTGDSLFPGGPGRTTSPEDFAQIMDDLEAKVFDVLPDDTHFYPGHGNDSSLGAERPHLAEWRKRGW
jgi:glyoxylase-like metal-dependent hydrolase (beta-lactamase superfamily II)